MTNIKYILITILLGGYYSSAQVTVIPDAAFEQELIDQGIDSDGTRNGIVMTSDISGLIEFEIRSNFDIEDLTGIQDFTGLGELVLIDLNITMLNIQPLDELEVLRLDNFFNSNFTEIDLTGNTSLSQLRIELIDQFQSLNVNGLTNLEDISISFTGLENLDLTTNTGLRELFIQHTPLSALDLSGNTQLEQLFIGNYEFDVGPFTILPSLDLSNNTNLNRVDLFLIALEALDVSGLTALEQLDVDFNSLSELNLSTNTALRELVVGGIMDRIFPGEQSNAIANLDLLNNTALTGLSAANIGLEQLILKNGNNDILTSMFAIENPQLGCVLVDDANAATNGDGAYENWRVDEDAFFSDTTCELNINTHGIEAINTFPNPFKDTIFIESPNQNIKITVFDVFGRQVFYSDNPQNNIETSDWPSGLYLMKIESDDKQMTRKLIKQ